MKHKLASWSFTTLLLMTGAHCMATSLRLPSPAELAGAWHLYPEGAQAKPCALSLVATGETQSSDLACATRLIGTAPATWYPTPDGIALVDGNGDTFLHLGRQREGFYKATLPNQQTLYLQRATSEQPAQP